MIIAFPSAAKASRQTGISRASISNNICGKSKFIGGFKWEKENRNC